MVWQEEVAKIVMLTNLVESNKVRLEKCLLILEFLKISCKPSFYIRPDCCNHIKWHLVTFLLSRKETSARLIFFLKIWC